MSVSLQNQKGATTLEYALVGSLMFLLVAALINFGIGFHRYNLLNHIVNTVVREYSAKIRVQTSDPNKPCSAFEQEVRDRAEEIFRDELHLQGYLAPEGASLAGTPETTTHQFTATVQSANPPTSMPFVRLEGEIKFTCFFCFMLPRDLIGSTASQAAIENDTFTCL